MVYVLTCGNKLESFKVVSIIHVCLEMVIIPIE